MHITESNELTANADCLGLILGIGTRRINQLVDKAAVIQLERGVFDVPASVAAYAKYLASGRKNQNSGASGGDYEAERTRLTSAKADMAEHQRDLLKGSSHDAASVAAVWAKMITSAKNKLLGLSSAAAPQMDGMNVAERKSLIDTLVREALMELADYSREVITGEYVAKHGDKVEGEEEG